MKYLVRLLAIGLALFWIFQQSGLSVNGYKSPNSLKVGECISDASNLEDNQTQSISVIKTINCQEPHNWQIIYTGDTSDNLGDEDSIVAYVEKSCDLQQTIFASQFTNPLKTNIKGMTTRYFYPSADSYKQGDRKFTCTIGSDEETTTGEIGATEVSKTSK